MSSLSQSTARLDSPSFVDTWMNWAGDIQGRARVDVADWSRTNIVLDKHDVRIFDGRGVDL